MVDGVADGPALSYDEAGHLSARLTLKAGQIHGPAEFYHEGRRVRTAVYHANLLHGESVDYDAQGTVVQSCTYQANLLHGPLRRYWPDGTLMEETLYREGKPQGAPKRYDSKGRATGSAEATPDVVNRLHRLLRGG